MEDDKHETKKNFTVRYLTTDYLEQYDALLRYSFQVTEQELFDTGWRSDEMQQSKFPVLERAEYSAASTAITSYRRLPCTRCGLIFTAFSIPSAS